ncbi:MAG: biopolymer transporter ExbD [Betaproteobacteria bacterium]
MAMNLGNSSGSDEPEVMMDINTTPLIDVMLVLLVMLIITIPIQLHSVSLEMPVGTPPTNQVKPEKIQIDIDAKSVVYWQGVSVAAEELDEKMKAISQQSSQAEVHIRPNKDARYAVFANVLSSSKRVGLTKIAVIGAEQFVQ